MSDRIADIHGLRTPHAKGTVWPARVDQYLDPGVVEADVESWIQSACLLCSNGCGMDIAVKDGRMVGVRGRVTDVAAEVGFSSLSAFALAFGKVCGETPGGYRARVRMDGARLTITAPARDSRPSGGLP